METIRKENLIENKITWFFLLIPHLKAGYLEYNTTLDKVFNLWRIVSFVLIIILIIYKHCMQINIAGAFLVLSQVWLLITTIIHGLSIRDVCLNILSIFSIVVLINLMTIINARKCLQVCYIILEIIVYINFYMIILLPNGLYNLGEARKYYLIGHVNNLILYVLPALALSYFFYKESTGILKIRYFLLIIIGIISQIYVWSATSIVGMTVFLMILFLDSQKMCPERWAGIILGMLLSAVVIYIGLVMGIQGVMSYIVQNILHRSLTLSGRVIIWKRALVSIRNNIWFGVGVEPDRLIRSKIGIGHCHNLWIQILYQGGILYTVIYIIFLLKISWNLKKNMNDGLIIKIFSYVMFVLLLMMSTESYLSTKIIYLIYALVLNGEKYVNIIERKE